MEFYDIFGLRSTDYSVLRADLDLELDLASCECDAKDLTSEI